MLRLRFGSRWRNNFPSDKVRVESPYMIGLRGFDNQLVCEVIHYLICKQKNMTMIMRRLVVAVLLLLGSESLSLALVFDVDKDDETRKSRRNGDSTDDIVWSDVPSDAPSLVPAAAAALDSTAAPSMVPTLVFATVPPVASAATLTPAAIYCNAGSSVTQAAAASLPIQIALNGTAECRSINDNDAPLATSSVWTSAAPLQVVSFQDATNPTTTATVTTFGTWQVCLAVACGSATVTAKCCTDVVLLETTATDIGEQGEGSGLDTSVPSLQGIAAPTRRPSTLQASSEPTAASSTMNEIRSDMGDEGSNDLDTGMPSLQEIPAPTGRPSMLQASSAPTIGLSNAIVLQRLPIRETDGRTDANAGDAPPASEIDSPSGLRRYARFPAVQEKQPLQSASGPVTTNEKPERYIRWDFIGG
ncbi:hypothetical protein MPSEU_000420500 [Mayamaea pseudoterrestris]|nr:hypothetical protein MPSEU_000420500 [Mayamaea pseudoterrestris]